MVRASGNREVGVAAIEFAFVAPVLIALILVIVDFGFRFQTMATYDNAAQAAARSMTVNSSQSLTSHPNVDAAITNAKLGLGPSTVTITMTGGATHCSDSVGGTYPNVTVTIENPQSPYLIKVLGNDFPVKGKAVAKCSG